MLVVVKIINGAEHSVEVSPDLKVSEFKKRLADDLDIPIENQRLMLKGRPLIDTNTLKDYSIEAGAKINLIVKKDNESNLTRQLKAVAKNYAVDPDQFATIFNKELKKLANEMSLDDIERYAEAKDRLKKNKSTTNTTDTTTSTSTATTSSKSNESA